MFQETSLALRAGELRRPNSVKARGNCRARCEEASAAWPWRAVGDSQDGAARTPRAVGRPVGSKKPKEASRRVWDCGIRGGRERIGMGGESLAWSGLCVVGRGCVCVLVCRSTRSCPRPRPGWIRVWVDGLSGGCPTGSESERARSRATRSAGSCVCVCVRPCGSALEPPGTHRNAASLSSPGRPLFHKEVAARKKGGKGAEIRLAQHEPHTKANLSHLLQEGPGGGQGTKESYRRASRRAPRPPGLCEEVCRWRQGLGSTGAR